MAKTYEVYKSNAGGEWYAGRVEAADDAQALADARRLYPSRNEIDQYRVAELTPEREEQLARDEAERALRLAARAGRSGYSQKCLDRKMAYLDKGKKNLIRAQSRLDPRGVVPESRIIERLAEKFERDHPVP